MRAIVTFIEKFKASKEVPLLDEFGNPDISGAMVKAKTYVFSAYEGTPKAMETVFLDQPLIPGWALKPYGYVLGALLLLTGLTLLLGILTRASLFVMGILYITLTFGFILYGGPAGDQGIASMALHLLLVVLALKWCDKHNRFTLTKN
jgi:thiosulfate dehydrogenase [quinone] large subunit